MKRLRRIGVVYRKELTDTLRDIRTILAMIVVPIVLYPLLMIVVVQALQFQRGTLEKEKYRVAVPDEAHRAWLGSLLAAETLPDSPSDGDGARSLKAQIDPTQFDISVQTADPHTLIDDRKFHVVLRVEPPPVLEEVDPPNRRVELLFDAAEITSNVARDSLSGILEQHERRIVEERLLRRDVSLQTLHPFDIQAKSVASPQKLGGALLGQIMPFLLVIMTVTGAIYPAIDLTAGERERGTLETLMSAPVPVRQIVAGKFLVIVTITLIITTLNLLSIGFTVQFGGLAEVIAKTLPDTGGVTSLPLKALPVVLVAMAPFAVFFSAVMLATCSFARTFKEAQNYMMPVIMAALLPAMIVSYMPTLRLSGPLAVLPVANVVALVRELFLGKYDIAAIAMVLGSTCFYAVTAVIAAAKLYGQEAVLFTDVGSYKTLLRRRFIRPRVLPGPATALLLLAIIFPIQFYWQSSLFGPEALEDMSSAAPRFRWVMAGCQLFCFAAPVLFMTWYLRLDWRETLSLRAPRPMASLGAILIAAGAAPVAIWLVRLQGELLPQSPEAQSLAETQQKLITSGPLPIVLLTFAVLPGICEELLFRGFLLAGLRTRLKPLGLCIAVGLLFGLYHVQIDKILLTGMLGTLLAFVCWRTGSIFLAMFIHAVNNGAMITGVVHEPLKRFLGLHESVAAPGWLLPAALMVLAAGLTLVCLGPRAASRDSGDPLR